MSVEETNKAVVRRFIEEVINQEKVGLIDELFSPELAEQVKKYMTGGESAFPDGYEEIRDMVAEGDTVMVRWNFRGTHKGKFFQIPATGKPVDIVGFAVYYLENGRIVDDLMSMDYLSALKQIGATITAPANKEHP